MNTHRGPSVRRAFPLLALLPLLLACGDVRERPLPFAPDLLAEPTVNLVAPRTNQTVIAGRSLGVQVHAAEARGLLSGVGFVARRIGPDRPTVAMETVTFGTLADTTVHFSFVVPDSLPNNAQIDIVGVAFGPDNAQVLSSPRGVVVLQCTPGAAFC